MMQFDARYFHQTFSAVRFRSFFAGELASGAAQGGIVPGAAGVAACCIQGGTAPEVGVEVGCFRRCFAGVTVTGCATGAVGSNCIAALINVSLSFFSSVAVTTCTTSDTAIQESGAFSGGHEIP